MAADVPENRLRGALNIDANPRDVRHPAARFTGSLDGGHRRDWRLENLEELRALDLQPAQLEKKGMHPAPWSGDSTAASGGLLAGISFGNALG